MKQHIMISWAHVQGMSIRAVAKAANCSEPHLRNILSGRKEPSLPLAKRLSELSGGVVPMDAFLKPEQAENA